MRPGTRVVVATLFAGLLTASCASASAAPAAAKRTFYMSAVEYKGSTEVAKEPFPAGKLPDGGGYIRKSPADGKWETSTYRWEPGVLVAYQGDDIELQIFGVNGAVHPGRIEGYDKAFAVKRGELTTVTFRADKAGVFRILCDTHNPSMTGTLVVLAR